jgi:Txe/YoeB family toxin of Txe-Axe toxin-antitoxin module
MFALRGAVTSAGYYKSPKETDEFYKQMYFEIKKIENDNPAEIINFIEKLNKAIGAQYSRR